MIFFYVKIDRAILPRLGVASYLCCLLLHSFITTKRHSSEVEPSYILIFRLIQSVVYPVGASKDCSCFTQTIGYNSKDFVRILTKIGSNNDLWNPTSVPNFNWIGVRVCELQRFLQVCEKTKKIKMKKNLKVCSLISWKHFTRFSSKLKCSLPW